MSYYELNSKEFIDTTLNLDMSSIYSHFEKYLKLNAKILDLGCGSGRDLKYFSKSYQVIGIEPSHSLAKFAKEYSQCDVIESTIQDYISQEKYDGIWACASLLHISSKELCNVFTKLARLLNNQGVIYCSFKYGVNEEIRNNRHFTDLTENSIQPLLSNSKLEVKQFWITSDVRPCKMNEKWLNLILSL